MAKWFDLLRENHSKHATIRDLLSWIAFIKSTNITCLLHQLVHGGMKAVGDGLPIGQQMTAEAKLTEMIKEGSIDCTCMETESDEKNGFGVWPFFLAIGKLLSRPEFCCATSSLRTGCTTRTRRQKQPNTTVKKNEIEYVQPLSPCLDCDSWGLWTVYSNPKSKLGESCCYCKAVWVKVKINKNFKLHWSPDIGLCQCVFLRNTAHKEMSGFNCWQLSTKLYKKKKVGYYKWASSPSPDIGLCQWLSDEPAQMRYRVRKTSVLWSYFERKTRKTA